MPSVLSTPSVIFALGLILSTSPAAITAQTQPNPIAPPAPQNSEPTPAPQNIAPQISDSQDLAETPEISEDHAPAAIQLDVTKSSPLIQTLYQATRETKEQPILDRLSEAKQLIESGTDLKATDQYGRTALHWTVFGSSYNTKPKIVVAYEQIADLLLQRGVEINRQDTYNDTALDYLLYSPNFEIQTLLIENGATSGFLIAFFPFFNQVNGEMPRTVAVAVAHSRKADLAPGQTLSIRLNGPVYSDRSRTGDPIEGTITYPLCKSGEDITCPDGELVLAPGTRVQATILFAQKAPDKYSRPRLVLDFSNIIHADGTRSPLYARVIDVDNARETVRNNEILGIVQPHVSSKVGVALALVGASNPIAGYTLKGISTVYGLSIRREILFPAGMLKTRDVWTGWPLIPVDDKLKAVVAAAPLRTHSKDNTLSDITNLMFLGSRQQIAAAFQEAGWFESDGLSAGSALKTIQATIRQTGYDQAPVSLLMIDGRPPDMVFQKSLDTFAKRHHLRIWKLPETYQGRAVWVGAATHDIDISTARKGTKWSHRIDSHIDREREWVETDLLYAGTATSYARIDRPHAPKKAANATGDDLLTDGKISVLVLGQAKPNILNPPTPLLQTR
jgi:hypothetical protein